MAKILWLLFLLSIAIRMIAGRWPWELLIPKRRSPAEQRARALLGISGTLTRDRIVEAHRRLLARVHPDRGGSAEQVHEANAARDLLLERLGPDQPV
jgi:hypothetical protein